MSLQASATKYNLPADSWQNRFTPHNSRFVTVPLSLRVHFRPRTERMKPSCLCAILPAEGAGACNSTAPDSRERAWRHVVAAAHRAACHKRALRTAVALGGTLACRNLVRVVRLSAASSPAAGVLLCRSQAAVDIQYFYSTCASSSAREVIARGAPYCCSLGATPEERLHVACASPSRKAAIWRWRIILFSLAPNRNTAKQIH